MDLPRIRLWEQAALRPGDCSPSVWLRRSETPTQDLRLARREILRNKATTIRGLVFSVCLCMPVGGAYALSSPFLRSAEEPARCKALSNALGPANQLRLRQYRASHGLTPAQQGALGLKICDSGLLSMIPALAASIADPEAFEEMAGRLEVMGGEVNTLSLMKLFLSDPTGQR